MDIDSFCPPFTYSLENINVLHIPDGNIFPQLTNTAIYSIILMANSQSTKNEQGAKIVIPKDPVILLSYINTQLRDYYPTLVDLCRSLDLDQSVLEQTLKAIDYEYDPSQNQFI